MSRIFAIATKEIRQLRRDRLTFGMIVGIPLLQMLLFGYAINFDVRGLSAGVVDEARTSMSRALVAQMQATGVVSVREYQASVGDLRRSLRSGEVSVGIYIPADFERRRLDGDRPLAQLLVDGSEPTIENIARAFAAMPLPQRAGVYRANRPVFEVRTEYNPEKRTAVQIVPALIGVILTMTMTMFTAVAIVRERERGGLSGGRAGSAGARARDAARALRGPIQSHGCPARAGPGAIGARAALAGADGGPQVLVRCEPAGHRLPGGLAP
jgi:ABC-2 type transport system permease protein